MVCDFAQLYHIFNWRELPPLTVATLAVGLPRNSRVKRKISGIDLDLNEMMMAMMVDSLNILIWQNTKDGQKNRNRPESIYKRLMGLDKKLKDELMSFDSIEEYEKWRKAKMEK
jgi:hypothetical protein